MSSQNRYLALFFDAPLQSWGYMSRFQRRMSLSYPTRSGIIGMICAASGIDRKDDSQLALFSSLELTVYLFQQGGRLTDFHTVGGGFDKNSRQNIVPKTDGSVGDTVVTYREYLTDNRHGAILKDRAELIEKIAGALSNPCWGIWLGRKCCIPASPVCQGIFSSREKALRKLLKCAQMETVKIFVEETSSFETGTDTLMDIPLNFQRRLFTSRRILVSDISEVENANF